MLRESFGKSQKIERKSAIDYVTESDRAIEAFLLEAIAERFPNSRAIAEEGGQLAEAGEAVWYIDPIDGTTNFAHGFPIFCVSIAYELAGELLHGVVFNPIHDELYCASKGSGATLNGERITVSAAQDLGEALLVTGFPYDTWTNPDNNIAEFTRFAKRTPAVRHLGSTALDLCYVAAARLDGFWEKDVKAWDLAAGALIAQEAGARLTRVDGSADYMSPPHSILAANERLHSLMLEVLQQ